MSNPLVKPLKSEDKELKKLIKFYDETLGFCPNSIKTMFIRPQIAYAFINLNKAVMENRGELSSKVKRLIGYLASTVSGCKYCQAHTIRAAERYGSNNKQLNEIWDFKESSAFTEKEKIAFEFTIAASSIPNQIDDKISLKLKEHWDDGEIVEMLGVISLFGFLNRWNDSMGTPIEEGALESGNKFIKNWNPNKHIS
ncbi:MAG: carboxymuconolactone decarboxylase family protein [Bacteroidota bacterium]|nr:carboxymuconolactone decarboxylase family protein [Bacteroidota bacterium]|tara:strand:- start:1368 stop:1958 length:591 start_codon:yes stop_codon:yes gene_type:complete